MTETRYNAPMNTTLAAANFAKWDAALLTGDPANVAALYTDNMTLLPTMAQNVISSKEGAVEYFTFFGSFSPRVQMVVEHVIPISDQSYVHCGVYRFTLTREKVEDVDARFTMVWQQVNGEWLILHHHSSRIPTI